MKEIQTQRINTYLDALRAYPPEWEALITEKERYTFGELIEAAESLRRRLHMDAHRQVPRPRYYNGLQSPEMHVQIEHQ